MAQFDGYLSENDDSAAPSRLIGARTKPSDTQSNVGTPSRRQIARADRATVARMRSEAPPLSAQTVYAVLLPRQINITRDVFQIVRGTFRRARLLSAPRRRCRDRVGSRPRRAHSESRKPAFQRILQQATDCFSPRRAGWADAIGSLHDSVETAFQPRKAGNGSRSKKGPCNIRSGGSPCVVADHKALVVRTENHFARQHK